MSYLSFQQRQINKSIANKKWSAKNKKHLYELNRALRQKNKERYCEYSKKHYQKNKEKILAKIHKWRKDHPEEYRSKSHSSYLKAKYRIAEYLPELRKKSKCVGCECILKVENTMVCDWCLQNYPHKYKEDASIEFQNK